MKPRVKICCISSFQEAQFAIDMGADAVGLVGHMPSGPGVIPDDLIFGITRRIPPPISTFLLTSETTAEGIIKHHNRTQTSTIQLVDTQEAGTYKKLRNKLPSVKLVQVIHVVDEKAIDEAKKSSEFVDAILLDSGNPGLKVKELGGTGRVHSWLISRKIRESIAVPVFVAGGLNSENVQAAITAVEPFGVDVCSGVRTKGKLDKRKLKSFFRSIQF